MLVIGSINSAIVKSELASFCRRTTIGYLASFMLVAGVVTGGSAYAENRSSTFEVGSTQWKLTSIETMPGRPVVRAIRVQSGDLGAEKCSIVRMILLSDTYVDLIGKNRPQEEIFNEMRTGFLDARIAGFGSKDNIRNIEKFTTTRDGRVFDYTNFESRNENGEYGPRIWSVVLESDSAFITVCTLDPKNTGASRTRIFELIEAVLEL